MNRLLASHILMLRNMFLSLVRIELAKKHDEVVALKGLRTLLSVLDRIIVLSCVNIT